MVARSYPVAMVVGMYWPDFVVAAAAVNLAVDDCSLVIECLAKSMVMDYYAIAQPFDRLAYAPVFAYVHDRPLDSDDQNRLLLDFGDQMNVVFAVTETKMKNLRLH